MAVSVLLEFFRRLPLRAEDEELESWFSRLGKAAARFQRQVTQRYSEGTLQRLLEHADASTRFAAILALRFLGTMESNLPLAACLHDDTTEVVELTGETLWTLWFRGDTPENSRALQRLIQHTKRPTHLADLDALIERAPQFAEAYNQRAIVRFQKQQFAESIRDCERVLSLNPVHFGAQVGMAHCYLQLHKRKAALNAFRATQRLHPRMSGLAETIRALERSLGS